MSYTADPRRYEDRMRLRLRIQIFPTVPPSIGAPSSSRSAITKPWIGLPIDPCLISPEGGLSVASPTSVIP